VPILLLEFQIEVFRARTAPILLFELLIEVFRALTAPILLFELQIEVFRALITDFLMKAVRLEGGVLKPRTWKMKFCTLILLSQKKCCRRKKLHQQDKYTGFDQVLRSSMLMLAVD